MRIFFYFIHFINKWVVLSFPDEIFLNAIYEVTLITLLSPFYWWSEVCQTFHLKPLFSGVYGQTVEKNTTSQYFGSHDLGSVEDTCFNKMLNSQLFLNVRSRKKKGIT